MNTLPRPGSPSEGWRWVGRRGSAPSTASSGGRCPRDSDRGVPDARRPGQSSAGSEISHQGHVRATLITQFLTRGQHGIARTLMMKIQDLQGYNTGFTWLQSGLQYRIYRATIRATIQDLQGYNQGYNTGFTGLQSGLQYRIYMATIRATIQDLQGYNTGFTWLQSGLQYRIYRATIQDLHGYNQGYNTEFTWLQSGLQYRIYRATIHLFLLFCMIKWTYSIPRPHSLTYNEFVYDIKPSITELPKFIIIKLKLRHQMLMSVDLNIWTDIILEGKVVNSVSPW